MQFVKAQAVALAQQLAGQPGRTRIMAQLAVRVEHFDEFHVVDRGGWQAFAVPQAADAVAVFTQFGGVRRFQGITPGAGMGVDDPERRRLFGHVFGNLEQDDVFQNVGMVAGVKGMTVAEH